MALLKHKNTTPPRGWFYFQEETKLRIEGDSWSDLVKKVVDHRVYRQLAPTDEKEVALEIERQICSRLSRDECYPEGSTDEWIPVNPTIHLDHNAIAGASAAAIEWMKTGGEFIPKEEATARQAICQKCPLNVPMTGCSCSTLFKLLTKLVPPDRKSDELGVCSACGCSLALKTNVPMSVVDASNQAQKPRYPGYCWANTLNNA